MRDEQTGRPADCPSWCILGHGLTLGEDDQVHVSAQLCVRNTLIRLCSSLDPETGEVDGPYVLMGHHEYTLDEVDALVRALSTLKDQAAPRGPRIPSPRAGS